MYKGEAASDNDGAEQDVVAVSEQARRLLLTLR